MVDKLKIITAAFAIIISIGAWPSSGIYPPKYFGPCDLVTCAEAYSVTRAMKIGYAGPLFQLYNGSTTLNIGQTASHKADMTTWSAFCSGVQSNCTVTKIYSQIHTTLNDLSGFSGTNALFTIETATGLPILFTNNVGFPSPGTQQYAIGGASDNSSTGINAGGAAETVLLNGKNVTQTDTRGVGSIGICCGVFGTTHRFTPCCTPGTDFEIMPAWSNGGGNVQITPCGTNETFCMGVDLEGGAGPTPSPSSGNTDYSGVTMNYVGAITYDGTSTMTSYVNTVQLNQAVSASPNLNSGNRIHLGGGGDMSGPDPMMMREGIITNSALTPAQIKSIFVNMTNFYPTLKFPTGQRPATYVAGPGDILSGTRFWAGLRAYTAAIAAAGTQPIVKVLVTGNSHTCDILVAANGGFGNTANCSNGADNGLTPTAFCTNPSPATFSKGMDCNVKTLYDQSGGGINFSGSKLPALTLKCIDFAPCMVFDAAGPDVLFVTPTLAASPQPYSFSAIGARTGNSTKSNIFEYESVPSTLGFNIQWATGSNNFGPSTTSNASFPSITVPVTDSFPHAFQVLVNSTSSSLTVDGSTTTGTLGTDTAAANPPGITVGSNEFSQACTCIISEIGFWPVGFTATNINNMNANQRTYWGF